MAITSRGRRGSLKPAGTVSAAVAGALTVAVVARAGLRLRRREARHRAQRHEAQAALADAWAFAEAAALEARHEQTAAVHDALTPLVRQLGGVVTAPSGPQRAARRLDAVSTTLDAAVRLVGGNRVRACWFELEPAWTALLPRQARGRGPAPTRGFRDGEPEATEVLTALRQGRARVYLDLAEEQPPGWDGAVRRPYRTFIAVPVEAADRCFGMLTLDSTRAGDLEPDDAQILRLLADVLATSLALAAPEPAGRPALVIPEQVADVSGRHAEQPATHL